MTRYINENDKKMDELLQKYIAGNASEKESQRIMEWLSEDEPVSYTHLVFPLYCYNYIAI